MGVKEKLDKVCFLLQNNLKGQFVKECLREIETGEIYFEPGTLLETSHAFKTYYHRFRHQITVTQEEAVQGYESLLKNLKQENDPRVLVITITIENAAYIMFTSSKVDRLIGVLKSSQAGIKKLERLHKIYKEKELAVSSSKFIKRSSY